MPIQFIGTQVFRPRISTAIDSIDYVPKRDMRAQRLLTDVWAHSSSPVARSISVTGVAALRMRAFPIPVCSLWLWTYYDTETLGLQVRNLCHVQTTISYHRALQVRWFQSLG
jgi:hypothetical protein